MVESVMASVEARRGLSTDVRAILEKLPAPDVVKVADELIAGRDNNNNNYGSLVEAMSRTEVLKSMEKLPTEELRNVLHTHGII